MRSGYPLHCFCHKACQALCLCVHITRGRISLPVPSSKDVSASLAYILTNKACPPLIPGTCSSPGTHNTIRSPEADRQGWVGMLVASLLPGQMAQLLGGEEASWRGVTALQRAQSSREQKCWQLLMHLPESKETVLARSVYVCLLPLWRVLPNKGCARSKREKLSLGIAGKCAVMSQLIRLERM